jgi:hypothetical protein
MISSWVDCRRPSRTSWSNFDARRLSDGGEHRLEALEIGLPDARAHS